MSEQNPAGTEAWIARYIADAAKCEIKLTREDFTVAPSGEPMIDGMPAEQWIEAMTME